MLNFKCEPLDPPDTLLTWGNALNQRVISVSLRRADRLDAKPAGELFYSMSTGRLGIGSACSPLFSVIHLATALAACPGTNFRFLLPPIHLVTVSGHTPNLLAHSKRVIPKFVSIFTILALVET